MRIALFDIVVLGGLLLWNAIFVSLAFRDASIVDFGKFHRSAVAFLEGKDMYGPEAARVAKAGPDTEALVPNMNPPHFQLLLIPLAYLPVRVGLAVWYVLSLMGLLFSCWLIVKELSLSFGPWEWRSIIAGLLAASPMQSELVNAQVSFVLLPVFTLAWVFARRECWSWAAVCLGLLMSIKPFFLIFLPFLLLWRSLRYALIATIACFLFLGLGVVTLGSENFESWARALSAVWWTWGTGNLSVMGMLARSFGMNPVYTPIWLVPGMITPLWLLLAGIVGVVTLVQASFVREKGDVDRGFSLLSVGAFLISPTAWLYYLWLPLGPLAATVFRGHAGTQWSTRLFVVAALGFLWPFPLTRAFQPHAWAAISFGSIYFWSTVSLWLALVLNKITLERSPFHS
jgi:hypothetical protein